MPHCGNHSPAGGQIEKNLPPILVYSLMTFVRHQHILLICEQMRFEEILKIPTMQSFKHTTVNKLGIQHSLE